MRSRIKLFALLVLVFSMLSATSTDDKVRGKHRRMVEEAEFFYSIEDYFMSKRIYTDLVDLYPENSEFNFKTGFSYLNLRNEEHLAIPFLQKASKLGHSDALYFLAEAYHTNEQFDLALQALEGYRERPDKAITHARIDRAEQRIKNAMDLMGYPIEVNLTKLATNVNSEFQDYAPNIDAEGEFLYFTSRRPESTGGHMDPDGNYFEDIFITQCIDGYWTKAEPVTGPVNRDGHDANVNFSSSGNTMIIYRAHKNLHSGDLYVSEHTREGWSDPVLMADNINTNNYHEPSAAFSIDERSLYIVSDRPGGYGGKDIYEMKKLPDGTWSEPRNLGKHINSAFDEDAPFCAPDGRGLYFASTGHGSIGGYDIYYSARDEMNEWKEPTHLGYPINSVKDDIYFSITASGLRGFLSSSRGGDMDIYEVNMLYEEDDMVVIRGHLQDGASKEAIQGIISVRELEGKRPMWTIVPNKITGKYVIPVFPGREYELVVEAEGYAQEVHEIEIEVEEKGVFVVHDYDISLTRE